MGRYQGFVVPLVVAGTVAAVAVSASADGAKSVGRTIPAECHAAEADAELAVAGQSESTEARWNRLYLAGIRAVDQKQLDLAFRSFCGALGASRDFDSRDWRFAETLDQLGLVSYLSHDLELAEEMQGAAVLEMLLTRGPQQEVELSEPCRSPCRSSVAVYAERLGWILKALDRPELQRAAHLEPYRLLDQVYLPLDQDLARRLDWLISQYLLAESFSAATWLRDFQAKLETEG